MPSMYFRQIRLPDIGCASYLVGGDGVCAVVDPRWDAVRQYLGLCRQQGLAITHVIETHTHADHVSGATRLASRSGATIHIHREAQASYPHADLDDGDELAVGPARISVLHTPGHSRDSISLLVCDAGGNDPPRLLTGDTLFVGDIGRPDLHGSEASTLASDLFDSLHGRLLSLDPTLEVLPGHLAGSLCGRQIAPDPSTTLERERATNAALAITDRAAFVREIVADLPPRPPNMGRIVELNRLGGPERRPEIERVTPVQAAPRLTRLVVVDGRDYPDFARGHLAGAINAPIGYGQFGVMVSWLVRSDVPLLLVAADEEDLLAAVDSLMVLGMTNPLASLEGTAADWTAAGLPVTALPTVEPADAARRLGTGEIGAVVDVREPREVVAGGGTIAGARVIPYREIPTSSALAGLSGPVVAVCNSGNRSALGASLLLRRGIAALNLTGGTSAWTEAGLPLETPSTAW